LIARTQKRGMTEEITATEAESISEAARRLPPETVYVRASMERC
jgi:hypothetical protein